MDRSRSRTRTVTRALTLAAAALVMGIGGATAPGAPAVAADPIIIQSTDYIWDGFTMTAGVPGIAPVICTERRLGYDVGGACFNLPVTGGLADIEIEDELGQQLVGRYAFQSGPTTTPSWGFFCGSIDDLPVPPEADSVQVYVLTQVAGGTCPVDSVATIGTIKLTLH